MRISNLVIMIMLLPITVFLWLIGWGLFWIGSRGKSLKATTTAELNEISIQSKEECRI